MPTYSHARPPSRRPIRPAASRQMDRREFLAWLGIGTGGIAAGGGLVWVLIHLLARRANDRLLASLSTEAAATAQATQRPSLPQPPIVTRETWGALPPDHTALYENGFYQPESNPEGWRAYLPPLDDIYTTVVIHHAAFYEADDISTLREIDRLHREDRGWADVAYHYLIGKAGPIYEGRPLNVRGVHTAGYNTGTVGVCLLGNFMTEYPTEAALRSTLDLLVWLAAELGLTHLAGHREFNPDTECPGTFLFPYLDVFASAAGLARGTAGYFPEQQPTPASE